MIKGNESDVADMVFEILAKKEFKFLSALIYIAYHHSVTRYQFLMGFASKCSIVILPGCGVKISKLKIFDTHMIQSFHIINNYSKYKPARTPRCVQTSLVTADSGSDYCGNPPIDDSALGRSFPCTRSCEGYVAETRCLTRRWENL